jgi:hypothetical protein
MVIEAREPVLPTLPAKVLLSKKFNVPLVAALPLMLPVTEPVLRLRIEEAAILTFPVIPPLFIVKVEAVPAREMVVAAMALLPERVRDLPVAMVRAARELVVGIPRLPLRVVVLAVPLKLRVPTPLVFPWMSPTMLPALPVPVPMLSMEPVLSVITLASTSKLVVLRVLAASRIILAKELVLEPRLLVRVVLAALNLRVPELSVVPWMLPVTAPVPRIKVELLPIFKLVAWIVLLLVAASRVTPSKITTLASAVLAVEPPILLVVLRLALKLTLPLLLVPLIVPAITPLPKFRVESVLRVIVVLVMAAELLFRVEPELRLMVLEVRVPLPKVRIALVPRVVVVLVIAPEPEIAKLEPELRVRVVAPVIDPEEKLRLESEFRVMI